MKKLAIIATAAAFGLTACTTNPFTGEQQASKTAVGAGVGAAAGAAIGALTGQGDKGKRALWGAAIGGLAGAGVGAYMDSQEAKLRQRLQASGVSVTRLGDTIVLNMPGNITFNTNEYSIKPEFFEVLNSVAIVLDEYDKTFIDVVGHTDSTGSDQYNLELSQRRASSVGQYLASQGVEPQRIIATGAGETRPVASNDTEAGRAKNRRVEIQISPIRATS